jgi:hypothetical protein
MKPEYSNLDPQPSPTTTPRASGSPQEVAGDSAGGVVSITPPSTPEIELTKCLGGEDWIELSLYLQHKDFAVLKKRLDEAKEAAEAHEKGRDELTIAGRKFLMLPSSALAGTDQKQIVYRWRMRSEDGWWLLLMNRAEEHQTLPTGIMRAPSLPLMRLGPKECLRQLHESLTDLSIDLLREKLSRVDPCADVTGIRLDAMYQAFMRGHYVSRARYASDHIVDECIDGYRIGRHPTGFTIGKGDVRLRVYDKFRKCTTDFEMLLLMQTRRWGGIGSPAIRAEFQVRREKLKSLGVDSLDDWWEKRGAITHYLSHEWFRLTDSEVDSDHTDRAETHADWLTVQEAFREWSGEPVADLAPLPRLPIRADNLLQQVIGTLVSYHARVGTNIDASEDFAHESMIAILDAIEDRDMADEVVRRALELGRPIR